MWEKTETLFNQGECYYQLWTHILARSDRLKKSYNILMDFFITNTLVSTSQDVNWWTGAVWLTCGLSFWRHPFTAEDPALSKWCNAKLIYIFESLRLRGIFFCGTIAYAFLHPPKRILKNVWFDNYLNEWMNEWSNTWPAELMSDKRQKNRVDKQGYFTGSCFVCWSPIW